MRKILILILAWFMITLFISGALMFLLTFISMFSDVVDPKYTGAFFVSSIVSILIMIFGDIELTIDGK